MNIQVQVPSRHTVLLEEIVTRELTTETFRETILELGTYTKGLEIRGKAVISIYANSHLTGTVTRTRVRELSKRSSA